jgi:hypothetical protein
MLRHKQHLNSSSIGQYLNQLIAEQTQYEQLVAATYQEATSPAAAAADGYNSEEPASNTTASAAVLAATALAAGVADVSAAAAAAAVLAPTVSMRAGVQPATDNAADAGSSIARITSSTPTAHQGQTTPPAAAAADAATAAEAGATGAAYVLTVGDACRSSKLCSSSLQSALRVWALRA